MDPVVQAALDEEAEMDHQSDQELLMLEGEDGGSNGEVEVVPDTSEALENASTKQQRLDPPSTPPGERMPAYNVACWKAEWRRRFFCDWRWDPLSKKIYARCKADEECANSSRYYTGSTTSFSNFSTHLKGVHRSVYDSYVLELNKKGDPKGQASQVSILTYAKPKELTKAQKEELNKLLAYTIAVDNIPMNVLRRHRFRKFIEVGSIGL